MQLKNDLLDTLKLAKNKDSTATINLLAKYKPLVNKYSYTYNVLGYDNDDLKQEGNIAILNAINKFNTSKGSSSFDSYAVNSIRNHYGILVRNNVKRKDDSSLNIISNDGVCEIISLLADTYDIEDTFIKKLQSKALLSALKTLPKEHLKIIKLLYIDNTINLKQYCKDNKLPYTTTRRHLKKSLNSLRAILEKFNNQKSPIRLKSN